MRAEWNGGALTSSIWEGRGAGRRQLLLNSQRKLTWPDYVCINMAPTSTSMFHVP